MWGLKMAHQEERLALIPVIHIFDGLARYHVGRVSGVHLSSLGVLSRVVPPLSFLYQFRVDITSLSRQYIIIIKTRRLRMQMPLADDSRLIPRLPQALSHVRVVGIQRVLQRIHPILLAVLPRKNRSPAGRTDRVGHEAILEYRAFMGDAVDIRRGQDIRQDASIRAYRLRGVVVGHNVNNIRAVGIFRAHALRGENATHTKTQGR